MIKYFQKAFKITNDNIILTTPMVLFLFVLSLYLGVVRNAPSNIWAVILLITTVFFMISAFFAGWFYMVQKAVEIDKREFDTEEEKAKASFGLIKNIPTGIGEFFMPFLGGFILYIILLLLIMAATYKVGIRFIGDIGLSITQIKMALASTEQMKQIVTSLNPHQLAKLNAWNLLILSTSGIFSFITMFWPAEIITTTKNPFVAFFKSLKKIFSNFLGAIILYIYISVVNFLVSMANAFSTIHPLFYFVSMLVYFYFLVYVVVLVFLYYDREIINKNNSYSGSDSFGEN